MEKRRTLEEESRSRYRRKEREVKIAKKITWIIVMIVCCVIGIVGLAGYDYVQSNLKPYDSADTRKIEVEVAPGTTLGSLAKQLEDMHLIKSATIFNMYLKTKDIGVLQAGNYALSPSMSIDEIIGVIKDGGTTEKAVIAKILVKEGEQIEQIAQTIANETTLTKDDVLNALKDETFIAGLVEKYPDLLTSMTQQSGLKYKLEGYLYPATYDFHNGDTVYTIISKMVEKADAVLKPYYARIKDKNLTVHQVLTIASLAEKEGVTSDDRKKIVSVFNNRIAQNMALQSDISVLYALGEHKELLTYADVEIDSPYNLYKNVGYGPGPFNSPSEDAIVATLEPDQTDNLYFVADLKTGKVYYSKTYEEHQRLVEKYVNNQNN